MVGHISCRTGIPGIKNIADHIRLILAGNKENKILRSKQKAAGHGYAFLPIIGIDTHLIRMKGRKQIFLPRKDRGGMPVVSSTEQNKVFSGSRSIIAIKCSINACAVAVAEW